MEIITDNFKPANLKSPVITVGTFDGVHAGHRVILKQVVSTALANGSDSVVVTFHPHPRIVLGQEVSLLNTRNEKREIIKSLGITHLVELPFTTEFADMKADEFISFIVNFLNPSVVVIGYDHGFGRNRSGDVQQLEASGKKYGFKVLNIPALDVGSQKVSSTVIRSLLMQGDVSRANELLTQPYMISGQVIRGNQIGKKIGFPTANLLLEDTHKLIPAMGVYATIVSFNNKLYDGMTNIGLRPTINDHQLTIETNIFNFNQDIYYEYLSIQLIQQIREEQKFGNLDMLHDQLMKDKETTHRILQAYRAHRI
ncbi:MAG: bifunctional riboflavin kinase/FAD synthetase [Lentimicrobiaceae bacterium]